MKKYESYSAFSLGWSQQFPAHWNLLRLKRVLRERKENNSPVKTKDILSLTNTRGVIPYSQKGNIGNKSKEDIEDYHIAHPDDLVLNSMNVVIGSVGVSKYYGAISPVYYALYPRGDENIRYFGHIFSLPTFEETLKGLGNGILEIRRRIPMVKLNNVVLPVPPRAEQDQIVRFLDWKTSRINRLTNTYRKEIDRIIELKSAIISQTVMRGLNPNAKMKNSGINWVGDIPQHWEMVPNKALFRKRHIEVGNSFRDFQLLSLTTSGIREKDISDVKGKVPASYEKYQIVRPNDMVFCLFDLDVSAVFAGVSHYNGMITSAYDTTECNEEYISPKYADYWFQFVFSERYYKMYSKNVRYTISFENFGMIKTPVPPRAEQDQIVEFLDKKASAFQRIIDIQAKRIELLKEYKNRLISDVVTGQIDVRDVEIPEYEHVEEIAGAESEDDEAELEEAESEVS